MKTITKSWKTTGAAIAAALASISDNISKMMDTITLPDGSIVPDASTVADWGITVPLVILAVGLLFARDHAVSSEDAGVV